MPIFIATAILVYFVISIEKKSVGVGHWQESVRVYDRFMTHGNLVVIPKGHIKNKEAVPSLITTFIDTHKHTKESEFAYKEDSL